MNPSPEFHHQLFAMEVVCLIITRLQELQRYIARIEGFVKHNFFWSFRTFFRVTPLFLGIIYKSDVARVPWSEH